jgi:feruloyl esterase
MEREIPPIRQWGWAGAIPTAALAQVLKLGFATAGTDDGHEGSGGAAWAIGHPQKLIDFGYRAVHQTSIQAKAIIRVRRPLSTCTHVRQAGP